MHKHLCRLMLGVLSAVLLAACAGAPQAEAPTSAPAPTAAAAPTAASAAPTSAPAATAAEPAATSAPTDDDIKAGIQQALDLYTQAYNEKKPDLLLQAADQTNAPFRRFIQTRFETFQASIRAGQQRSPMKVAKILGKLDFGFVVAQIESDGLVADWTFRQVGGRWVMSEPTEKQLGKREKIEGEHFVYYAYPWSKETNTKIMELMESARKTVEQKLGKVPDTKPSVYIRPIFGVGGPQNANVLAYYDRNLRAGDRIVVYGPEAYVFGFYDPSLGWEKELELTLAHEYTHLANHRSFTSLARMNDWMVEGLAEYVSNPDAVVNRGVPLAVSSDKIIPIIDTSGVVNKQDLEHLTILDKDVSLAYGLATSLVEYVNETYGGMDGFWKLVQAYDKVQNFDKALQEAYGIGYEQFDKDWRAWLKAKYG
jgi:hypothetical protein